MVQSVEGVIGKQSNRYCIKNSSLFLISYEQKLVYNHVDQIEIAIKE